MSGQQPSGPQVKKDHHLISVSKGATWRVIATMDTMLLSYLFTGSIGSAFRIGITEVFTKILLFYLHERAWFRVKWGLVRKQSAATVSSSELEDYEHREDYWDESHQRSIAKGISWRIVGTIDTIIIAVFWTGDFSKALKIGFTEVITKVFLYYVHERIWMRLKKK